VEAFLLSALAVAVAEIGDKTQLLALLLAARYRRPLPIIAGMLLATLANHALAGALGNWLGGSLDARLLRWGLGLGFLAMAVWMLRPDRVDADDSANRRFGPFLVTLIAFFLAEIGDKTQIATIALAARFESPLAVVLGTTTGMMAVNVPVVLLGGAALKLVPMRTARLVAAVLFAAIGIATLIA